MWKNDLLLVLGDFNVVTGISRFPGGDSILQPWCSGLPNENSDLCCPSVEVNSLVLPAHGSGGRTSMVSHRYQTMVTPANRLTTSSLLAECHSPVPSVLLL